MTIARPQHLLVLLALWAATLPARAQGLDCERLRDEVQQRLQANGVADATVLIEPVGPVGEGAQLLGRCELGSRQLVWRRDAAARRPAGAVITECDDGRRVTAGRCPG